jgi:hypothetical protein
MKISIIIVALFMNSIALAEWKNNAPNALNHDRLSTFYLAKHYDMCVHREIDNGVLAGQAQYLCSCWGDYLAGYLRYSMTAEEQQKVIQDSKQACGPWVQQFIITTEVR